MQPKLFEQTREPADSKSESSLTSISPTSSQSAWVPAVAEDDAIDSVDAATLFVLGVHVNRLHVDGLSAKACNLVSRNRSFSS